jgi:SAM-dependent methyltransferase
MAHEAQAQFIRSVKNEFPRFFNSTKVLEIGSLNINGTVRQFFDTPQLYVGVDVAEGAGVDVVSLGHEYDTKERFDCVISCECMEHNPYWSETFTNMARLCRPGGMVLMTCATTGRPEHGTPRSLPQDSPLTVAAGWDYYRNLTEDDFYVEIPLAECFSQWNFSVNTLACDLYFAGIKVEEARLVV